MATKPEPLEDRKERLQDGLQRLCQFAAQHGHKPTDNALWCAVDEIERIDIKCQNQQRRFSIIK